MSLYAIGDFHLSFTVNKPMDVFDKRWKNHVAKIEKHWKRKVTENDTVVITGDHSWGRDLAECQADLDFIMALPGRKILLRGNHDMFWDAKKTEDLNEMFWGKLEFLQNNFYTYEDYALVGTKGYCYEGKDSYEHFLKIRERELGRLRCSFEAAKAAGYEKFIMFLHYPPTRMLPDGVRAQVKKDSYEVPAIFKLLAKKGDIDEHMMYNTYNMGVGMCLAIDTADADKTIAAIEAAGDKAFVLGTVVAGEKGVDLC